MKIKDVISAKGLTAKEVAARMLPPITPESLSNAINGNPTVETLERIATAIGCLVSDFFEQPQKNSFNCPHCGKEIKIGE